MREYTCLKCGTNCEVTENEDHPGCADSWCDECEDYPQGFDSLSAGVDFLTDRIDRAHDEAKDRRMGL